MKGIVLAGGKGSRLFPITLSVSKQLLPVYDKPMVYYPISTLMLAGIKDILIITTVQDQAAFQRLLGDGTQLGIHLSYAVQEEPKGIAEAFIIAEQFIGDDAVSLVLGDNIFFGQSFSQSLLNAKKISTGATVFGYQVKDPERFGVVEFDDEMKVVSIEEKPKLPKSSFAITGLYFYDNRVVEFAKKLKPSVRGELEITDINAMYLDENQLNVEVLGRGFAWFDTGTCNSMFQAGSFVEAFQSLQGMKIACLEEIAWRNGWIDDRAIVSISAQYNNDYGDYLMSLLNHGFRDLR